MDNTQDELYNYVCQQPELNKLFKEKAAKVVPLLFNEPGSEQKQNGNLLRTGPNIEKVLELITNSGSNGISSTEILGQIKLSNSYFYRIVGRLKNKKAITVLKTAYPHIYHRATP